MPVAALLALAVAATPAAPPPSDTARLSIEGISIGDPEARVVTLMPTARCSSIEGDSGIADRWCRVPDQRVFGVLPESLTLTLSDDRVDTVIARVPWRTWPLLRANLVEQLGPPDERVVPVLPTETPNTPAVTLLYALAAQLENIEKEGLQARFDRHTLMARRVYAWVDEMREERGIDLHVLAPEGYRSPTVTCIKVPDGWSGPRVAAGAAERGFTIATGYGAMREATFRIGHMGDHTPDRLELLLDVLTDVFTK